LERFEQVLIFYVFFALEVGNGAGEFDDSVIGAGGEVEFFGGRVQEMEGALEAPSFKGYEAETDLVTQDTNAPSVR